MLDVLNFFSSLKVTGVGLPVCLVSLANSFLFPVQVDLFLSELERRLDYLEKYGNLKIDHGIEQAYQTLHAVRDECGRVGGEVIGEGRRRARAMVEILEARYHETLEAKETLPAKVHASVEYLSELLSDFESRSFATVEQQVDNARKTMEAVIDAGDKLAESIELAIKAAREGRLITYEELPFPWRVNEHIHRGYRFSETKWACVKSAFTLNNETCNIWSHGIGFILICSVAFYFYPTSALFKSHTLADKIINGVFFLCAAKCLACSTIWHTFSSISHQSTMERFACVDYSGISMLVTASILTTEYTAFYWDPYSRFFYMALTSCLGAAGVVLPWRPIFNRADMRVYRVLFYVVLAASGFLPIAQLLWTRGLQWTVFFYMPITKSLLVYLTGATIYALQAPECFLPGWFDFLGASHNIWHFCVLGGIFFHWWAMHDFFTMAWGLAKNEMGV
jgi:adiponectin receptor